MPIRRSTHQKELFEPELAIPAPKLPKATQKALTQALMQWLQALAKARSEERGDE